MAECHTLTRIFLLLQAMQAVSALGLFRLGRGGYSESSVRHRGKRIGSRLSRYAARYIPSPLPI